MRGAFLLQRFVYLRNTLGRYIAYATYPLVKSNQEINEKCN